MPPAGLFGWGLSDWAHCAFCPSSALVLSGASSALVVPSGASSAPSALVVPSGASSALLVLLVPLVPFYRLLVLLVPFWCFWCP